METERRGGEKSRLYYTTIVAISLRVRATRI